MIITDDLIIEKMNDDNCRIEINRNFPVNIFSSKKRKRFLNFNFTEDLEKISKHQLKDNIGKNFTIAFIVYLFFFLVPIVNLHLFLSLSEIIETNNILSFVMLSALIFSFVSILYCIHEILLNLIPPKKIRVYYSLPVLNYMKWEPLNISKYIILSGQIVFFPVFVFMIFTSTSDSELLEIPLIYIEII